MNSYDCVGGDKSWSLLVNAIEAANEGVVRDVNAVGVVGERLVIERA